MTTEEVEVVSVDSVMDSVAAGMNTGTDDDDSGADAGNVASNGATQNVASDAEDIAMPQSWKKEWEPDWKATPRPARERFIEREKQMLTGLEGYKADATYGRTLRDAFKPHMDILQKQGLSEVQAVQYLLAAHRQLSDPNSNTAYLQKVAQQYGIKAAQQAAAAADAGATPPEIAAALQRLDKIEGHLTERQREDQDRHRDEIGKQVDAFAADPKNIYFNECGEDIAKLITAGYSLQDAYDKASWANPVTREKRLAQMKTEQAEATKQAATEAAKQARKGTSVNVKGRDTARASTEPVGKVANMETDMKETLAEIKSRTH